MDLKSKAIFILIIVALVIANSLSLYFIITSQNRAKQIERTIELERKLVFVTNEIKKLRIVEVTNEMVISNARPIAESDLDGAIKLFYSLNTNK